MKILVFSQYFFPESFPINALVSSLAQRKIQVDILTGQPNYPSGRIFPGYKAWRAGQSDWHGNRLYRIPIFPRGEKSAFKLLLNYLSFIVSGLLVAPCLLLGRRYDVIFVYAPSPILQAIPAILVGWLKRAPVVLWVQDLWPESLSATGYVHNSRALHAVDHVVKWIYRRCDLLLGQSHGFVDAIKLKAPERPVRYFPNPVDPIFEHPAADAGDIPELEVPFSVVFTGNVGTAQAVEVILEAASLLKNERDIHFVVFGKGSRWNWLREQALARGLDRLLLAGQRPLAAMPAVMRKASVLLVSLADQPIFASTVPSKVQAYMAAGRPIVGSLNGEGARLLEEAGAGLAVAAGDARALAGAILELYRMDPARREAFGANGHRYYREHFEHEKLVDQLLTLVAEASNNRKNRK
ncbi:MAG: putative glycosyl transferase, group 1 family protein [Paucimonas sp.]|nr:putative glycosyl transferase, group 1 family protein [Paucimonas sp.]